MYFHKTDVVLVDTYRVNRENFRLTRKILIRKH